MKIPKLYAIVDTATLARRGLGMVEVVEGMLEGGARLLQYRHKGAFTRGVLEEARQMAELCAAAGAQLVIDDRADVALLLGAGVHVGQEDLLPADARRVVGEGLMVGYSTHNAGQLAAGDGEPVDYLAIGPVYATGSKENPDPVVGVEGLRELRKLTRKPLVGIGGITRERAGEVMGAGLDAVAVISDLLAEGKGKVGVRERVAEWVRILG